MLQINPTSIQLEITKIHFFREQNNLIFYKVTNIDTNVSFVFFMFLNWNGKFKSLKIVIT